MTEPVAEIWSFPTELSEFDNDDRISFSKLDNKYIAVQDDGTEYEFDTALKRWIPMIDEDLIAAQQAGYDYGQDRYGNDDSKAQRGKKRKQDGNEDSSNNKRSNNKQRRPPGPPKQNTAIYVTGLPPDATVDEVAELFSRKCGVIAEEIDSGRPRVKLYTNDDGAFKGDALIVFFKPQSVDMAMMLLDDTDFRFSASGMTSGKMRVQPADASYKKTSYGDEEGGDAATTAPEKRNSGGASNGGGGARRSEHDKQKIIRKTQKLDAKLADWSDDEDYALPQESRAASKWDKVVILKHMFTLQELEEDPAALLEIKEDIREECAKLGEVTNVVLYDQEEDGIVSVKFKKPESAIACIELMDGRAFDGRTVEANVANGREKFRKSNKKDAEGDEGSDDD